MGRQSEAQMAHSYRLKIGLREIAAMQPHTILWDLAVRGFHCRRQYGDAVTFAVFYRYNGLQRWHRIGRLGVFTPNEARREAIRVLQAVALGNDPSGARTAVRNSPTMAEFLDEYVADMEAHRITGKKASTIKTDKSRIAMHIRPKLGKLKVASVTQEDLETFMRSLSDGSQGRILGLTSGIFSYAIKRKLRPDNPCRGIKMPKDRKRNRRLSHAEYVQLGASLNGGMISDIFLFLAVTGFRSGEAKNLRWEECDMERNIVTLTDTKTGVSVRPLSNIAIEIIKRQKQCSAPYVFAYRHDRPVTNLTPYWNKLGMPKGVSPHVLRHSLASLSADLGLPDHTIARLLGHRQSSMTSRYIHMEKIVIEASNLVATETIKLMNKK